MSLISKTEPISQTITYTKANEFFKLLDEEHPAQELLLVLSPGTYNIGKGPALLHWDGKVATHTPPAGEVEVYDYLVQSGHRGKQSHTSGTTGLARHSSTSMGYEIASVHNGSSRGLQSSLQSGRSEEMQSPWARGWDNLET